MPGRTLQADATSVREQMFTHVPRIFDQAQISTANHQKNLVALYKLQTEAAQYTEFVRKGREVKLVGERIFEDALIHLLVRVLPLKKGTLPADRIVKFVGGYIKFINEKAAEEKHTEGADDDESETTASRFTARLLKFLLKGFLSKDKSVRYRVLQTVAEMVSHLGEIDEDIYSNLRSALLDRVNDKEVGVRVQAVIALSKLSGSEDPSEVEEGEQTVLDILLSILAHESSPEVRRAVLLNIPINPTTLPHILQRTRDTDNIMRRLVFSSVLEANVLTPETDTMGPTHPRKLTIAQRELVIRNGLGDREPSVRKAVASLLGKWVDVIVENDANPEEEGKKPEAKVESGLVALLNMFYLADPIAAEVVLSVFETRVDIFENMEFGNDYWMNLTPETAFLARVFVDHCKATKDEVRLEAALPVVTALAFHIQEAYNELIENMRAEEGERIIRDLSEEEKIKIEEARADKEFIIGEMLHLAVNLDYSDEIGRRKMFQLVRDMLCQEELPENLLAKCLDVLRELSASERDLIRVVVEIVQDLRDPGDNEEDPTQDIDAETNIGDTPATVKPLRTQLFNNSKPATERSPEEVARADAIDLRCLSLCIGMLERVNGKLEDNSSLDGILQGLIMPAVGRKDLAFQEKGLVSLGLCCLIARRLALNAIPRYMDLISKSPEVLKIRVLQVVFDMLMVHEHDLLGKDGGDNGEKITNYLTTLLGEESSEKVQALLCIGISKLVLSGMITNQKVLQNLILAYLSPATVDNQELRQCLTFFFPVYSYSSPINQRVVREIFIETFSTLNTVRKDLDDDEEMISAAQVGALFVDWTDPLKLSKVVDARGMVDAKIQADYSIHLQMAIDIFKALLDQKFHFEKEEKRALCQLLGKLHVPETVDDDQIKQLKVLMHTLRSRRPLRDTTANNAFTKFEAAISKKFETQLEDFDEEEYRKLEHLVELFRFVDDIIPDDDDDVISLDAPRKKGKKRRSDSIATTSTEGDESKSNVIRRGKSKTKTKKQRLSTSDGDSDSDITELSTLPPPSAPRRTLPKRSAATRKPIQIIEVSSDDDEQTPPARTKKRAATTRRVKDEEQLSSDIDEIPDKEAIDTSFDSIMDDDDDDDEVEEVNDLLAED